MSGVSEDTDCHKELRPERIQKDEEDVLSLITTITEKMVNLWEFDSENTEKDSLLNIATELEAPSDVAKSLLSAKDQGKKAANGFLDKHLTSGDRSFRVLLAKMKLKSFASLAKPLKLSKGKEKQVVINADRQLWKRLEVSGH